MNDTVEYRDIPSFPGYRAGSDGSIWSSKQRAVGDWRKLSPCQNWKGYLCVRLSINGRQKRMRYVHALVLEAFVGPRPKGMVCRHFPDRDRTNNRLENLSWGTLSENVLDSISHGTYFNPCIKRRATPAQVQEVLSRSARGESAQFIAEQCAVSITTVRRIVAGKGTYPPAGAEWITKRIIETEDTTNAAPPAKP